MNSHDSRKEVLTSAAGCSAPQVSIPELVGKIYDAAPATERCRMLEHLMKPLGALSLVGVCNGLFAKIWFRSGWHDLRIRPEDTQIVQPGDVVSLVTYVQQASTETVNGLASLLANSPMVMYSTAAAMLVAILAQRVQRRESRE